MMTKDLVTRYVPTEGRAWMTDCLRQAANWCLTESIATIVIFTGTGEGPYLAATEILIEDRYKSLKVVAVTPPAGRPYKQDPNDTNSPVIRSGLSEAMREKLTALGVPVVSAHLPFKERWDGTRERSSEWTRVSEAYGVLGGGFALCIQAALVSCDAGMISHGSRVVTVSADTALAVRACRTESFLSPYEGLLVEHIICRPSLYTISKNFHETIASDASDDQVVETTGSAAPSRKLPEAIPSTGKDAQGSAVPKAKIKPKEHGAKSAKARPRRRT